MTQISSATASADAPKPSTGTSKTLQFNDNTLLPLLLGDHDRHLVRIEQALGVRLSCRGNRIATPRPHRSLADALAEALPGLANVFGCGGRVRCRIHA